MKTISLPILLVLVLLSSCKRGENTKSEIKESSALVEKPLAKNATSSTPKDLEGLWKFTYPYPSVDLVEDHYMKIEQRGVDLSGIYYGTTDDFDRAREGYLPGFFSADMRDLTFIDDTLNFRLQIREDELYQAPVSLTLSTNTGYQTKKWAYSISFKEREYRGVYKNGKITLFTWFDPREFVRSD